MDIKNKIRKNSINDYITRPDYRFNDLYYNHNNSVQLNLKSGRVYETPNGDRYPSVTTILSKTKTQEEEQILIDWRNRVGEEEANKISKEATDRGTLLHELCEKFIKNELTNEQLGIISANKNTNSFYLWKQVYPILKNRIDNIYLSEGVLYSDTLKCAGTVDLICEWDGELSVIDFKTTKKPKKHEWITNYYIQESLYGLMLYNMYGLKINKIITIMARDNEIYSDAEIFVNDPKLYYKEAIEKVKQYYDKKKNNTI